ncbi:MAG: metallophosphoesterase [Pirellulales bacterium]
MRLAWLTDLHLDFLEPQRIEWFMNQVERQHADAYMISGDISDGRTVIEMLNWFGHSWSKPIYFVLGNHDFYGGSIRRIRKAAGELSDHLPRLTYLTVRQEPVLLNESVALVGHDGWADARIGDYERSMVMMSDYKHIQEFQGIGKRERWDILKAMGREAADVLRTQMDRAVAERGHVLVCTHVPPLREACWHEGALSDDEWAPHFTCLAIGELLIEFAERYPRIQFTVVCGHTHSPGECRPRANLHILTGGARYGAPTVCRTFDLEGW